MARTPGRLVILLVMFLLFASAAGAATLTWPGAAPCNTTLQACIAGAGVGDTVEVASNGPIVEDLTVLQSLTLQPAIGYTPVITGYILLEGAAATTTFTVQGMTVTGFIRAFPGTGDMTAHILNNDVTLNNDYGIAIEVSTGSSPPYGNVIGDIRGNTVTVNGSGVGAQCMGINFGPTFDPGTSSVQISGNTLAVHGCGQGAGIMVNVGNGETLTADVIGNRVDATNTNNGIMLRNFQQAANSLLIGRIINNVVFGQLHEAGFPGAIVVTADGFEPITIQVVNNTLAYNNGGLGMGARTDLGGSITGNVSNNIVAFNSRYGMNIGTELAATVTNNNNLVFGNGSDDWVPGTGSVTADPLFVSNTDFHLTSGSPAIDAGRNASVPPDITTDIEGNLRIQGAAVDIGAYEAAVAATTVPALDPRGLALLIAALIAAALFVTRR